MKKILLLLFFMLTISCQPYQETIVNALTAFPGYLNDANKHSYQLLAETSIGDGKVILYAYQSTIPGSEGDTCIATTFVTQKESRGWRSHSASQLGCRSDFLQTTEFAATATVGGNITELAVAYGVSSSEGDVRVSWNDGGQEMTPVENNVFIVVRPSSVLATKIELLDSNGTVLQTITP
jgi:hypothetical protein